MPDRCGPEHQARQHRPQFLDHRGADQASDERPRAELIERDARLQREHRAGEKPGEHHHRQRADPDLLELLDDVVKVERAREGAAERRRLQPKALPAPRDASFSQSLALSAPRPVRAPIRSARARGCAGL